MVRLERQSASIEAPTRFHLEHSGIGPGMRVLMMDFDLGAPRTEPPIDLFAETLRRVVETFRRSGADPLMGTRLFRVLGDAGLVDVRTVGFQPYVGPEGPGAALLAGVARSLLPAIVKTGVATAEEVGIDTLEARLRDALMASQATVLLPVLAAASGRVLEA